MYNFIIGMTVPFLNPGEYMYYRINREWEREYKRVFGKISTVDFKNFSRLKYALDTGYRPDNHAVVFASQYDDPAVFQLLFENTMCNSFTLALCITDNPNIVKFLLHEKKSTITKLFIDRDKYECIETYQEALLFILRQYSHQRLDHPYIFQGQQVCRCSFLQKIP